MRWKDAFHGTFWLALLAFFAWLSWSGPDEAQVGPPNQIQCNQIAIMAAGPVAITSLVGGGANQRVYICGWHVTNTGTAGTFSFQASVGSSCASPVTLIPAVNVTSSAPSADHIDYAQWSTLLGTGLCITPSVATISAVVWFAQF